MSRRSLSCAVYTRKSTEEGLDQDFNSLDAQRSACSAYIRSQASEGWKEIKTRYDDGGYSGGSVDRPALQQLLSDIRQGRIKVVVVYKVDRLTRSLADFAKIIEILEAHDASFVSVTQQFSTTTSMGRLTLNVLLSFAQFEREVTAERIRDKIAASKKKGMWMGGVVPLGYDVLDRKLVINKTEAATVRRIFELYRRHANTRIVKDEVDRLGLCTKQRNHPLPRLQGGRPFTRGHINKILTNRLYIGEIIHKGSCYPGEHKPIIDRELWDTVQAQLGANAVKRRSRTNAKSPSLLTGLLVTADGTALSPSHASKNGKRYRYYVSRPGSGTNKASERWRLPAPALEASVIDAICRLLNDRQRLAVELMGDAKAGEIEPLFKQATAFAGELKSGSLPEQRAIMLDIVRRVVLCRDRVATDLRGSALRHQLGMASTHDDCDIVLDIPMTMRRRGVETKLVIENEQALAILKTCSCSVRDLAEREGMDKGEVSRVLPLAFLAPDIAEAILDGRQPPELTASRLKRLRNLPLNWEQQRRYLGFA
jgi:DNA invertase Pin-like site-specific DNA recombinase